MTRAGDLRRWRGWTRSSSSAAPPGCAARCAPRPPVATELDLASNDYLGLSQHPDVIDGGVAGAAHLGCGIDRIAAGHRQHRPARAVRTRARRIRRRTSGFGVLLRLHRQPRRGRRAVRPRVAAGVGRATRTPPWSTRAGSRGPGWWSRRTATSTPSTPRWRPATRSAPSSSPTRCSVPTARWPRCGALHDVCRRHGALLMVDEAHGLGVRGAGGRGLLHEVGLAGAPDVVMTTTLSKALGSQGGAVLGRPRCATT